MTATDGVARYERIRREVLSEPTLRDQFAMAALTGQLANPHFNTNKTPDELAKSCRVIADALLAAREAK